MGYFSRFSMFRCFLLTTCLLLITSSWVLASNPDSEIAQDSNSSSGDTQRSSQLLQNDDGRARDTSLDPNSPGQSSVSYNQAINPIRTGTFVTREVIRQVLPNGYVTVERRNRLTINSRVSSVVSSNERPFANPPYSNNHASVSPYGTRGLNNNYGSRFNNRPLYGQPQQPPIGPNQAVNNFRPNDNPNNENVSQIPQRLPDSRVSSGSLNVNPNRIFRPNVSPRRTAFYPFGRYSPRPNRNISNFGGYRVPVGARNPPPAFGQNMNRRISPDMNLYSGIVNDFAFRLLDAMNIESNFVVSPLSVFIALSMCYLGAEGSTKAQLENLLGLDTYSVHGDRLHQGIRDLTRVVVPQSSQDYQLFIANAIFLGRNFAANPEYQLNVQRLYAAELRNLDFGNPQLSVPIINDWVSRATRNMITKMIDEPPTAMTRLMLLNAIYFKGIWKKQFPTNMTYVGRFFAPDGQDKMVPTMPLYGESFPMYRSDSHRHTFIKLPYQGDQISMIIALPFTFRDKPMPSNTDQILCHVRDAMKDTVMDTVTVPKFKMEHTMSLKNPLTRMGITDLFNPRSVNLSKLRSANDVIVSEIAHKAVVEVNEQGTTASASTAVRFVPLAYKNTTDFVVNHPFAYYIIHEPSGLVLFYGKVYDIGVDPASDDRPVM